MSHDKAGPFYFGTSEHGQKVHAITSRSRGQPLCNNGYPIEAQGRFVDVPISLRCEVCHKAVTRRLLPQEGDGE